MWRMASLLILVLTGVACGGGKSSSLQSQPTSTLAAATRPQTNVSTPDPNVAAQRDLILQQKAFITARGYYPDEPLVTKVPDGRLYAFHSTCAKSVTVNHQNCQVVHFFMDATYLGTDTKYAFYGYETLTVGTGHVTVTYLTYAPADAECCPTVSKSVVYVWQDGMLTGVGEPPRPRDEPFERYGELANTPAQLYIAAYPDSCAPASLTLPADQEVNVTFVNESGRPLSLQFPGFDFMTTLVPAGGEAAVATTFPARPEPYSFNCGTGAGKVLAVKALPES